MKKNYNIQKYPKNTYFKCVITLAVFIMSVPTFAQSKKEQIFQLNQKSDSLGLQIVRERGKVDSLFQIVSLKEIQLTQLNDELVGFQKKTYLLETELEKEKSIREKENSIFKTEKTNLEKIIEDYKIKIVQLEKDINQRNLFLNELKNSNKLNEQNLLLFQNKILEKDKFIANLISSKDSIIRSLQSSNQMLLNKINAISINTVKIGTQVWMQEDLKVKNYNNGDQIYEAQSPESWQEYGKRKIGCYRILKNGTFCYNGYALEDERGIVPIGFKVPSYADFKILYNFLGSGSSSNGKAALAMATYTINFESHDGEKGPFKFKSNGQSGFNAKKGGFVYDHGDLDNMWDNNYYNCSYWWTSTSSKIEWGENSELIGANKVVDIGYCSQDLGGGFVDEQIMPHNFGFAVRPIKK